MRTRSYVATVAMGAGLSLSVGLSASCTTAVSSGGDGPPVEPEVHGVDLLLVVDNSISMADKQTLLAPSIARLLGDLVNPPCFDPAGVRTLTQPASAADACPAGSERTMEPVLSLHVGVISSSLGALGAHQCDGLAGTDPSGNDRAHLLTRHPAGGDVPTYQDLGYLAWDPDGALSPPGESDFDALVQAATDLVIGVGEVGCGYEMPLEASARFLADPAPYEHLELDASGATTPVGIDETLLAQRAAFLRPDSLVAVVLLSDENDCSIDVTRQPGVLLDAQPMFRARAECATDANDACCTSCGLTAPEGCPPDAACVANPTYDAAEDPVNLRCFDQKRRYGVDFKYPTERYVHAFSDAEVDSQSATFEATAMSGAPNPLFEAGGRAPQHVIFTSIVGVPWQELATNSADPESALKTTSQMETDGTWTRLLGQSGGMPTDPFMRESTSPREGTSPVTGESVSAPNSINGGDRPLTTADGDLQYVCTFALETGAIQTAAKAYPGARQLALVRALGDRGIAASICGPGAASAAPGGPPPISTPSAYAISMDSLQARIASGLGESGE